jgi:hypothetical protein
MNSTSADLTGRRALVSGAAGGVGAACVNAGIQHVAPVEQFPPEIFTKILAVRGISRSDWTAR